MKGKTKLILTAVLFFAALAGCKNSPSTSQGESGELQSSEMTDIPKFAKIVAPEVVDMGIFDKEHSIKIADVEVLNSGESTLFIRSVVPECDCTEILSVDSLVEPHEIGKIVVSLDMTKYPADTIYKTIHILSNDPECRVLNVNLMADRRR